MKRVILSFDYELFFGDKCGTVESCLIVPTQKILDALSSVRGRAVFFVDYLMLKRMREENDETKKMAFAIEEQLRQIVKAGSRIELHLHPHWVDAKYKGNGGWDFSDHSHYCLDSLSEDVVTQIFVEGVKCLNEIAMQVDPTYRVSAFRAGGWAIFPFDKLKDWFRSSGITIDSSVCKGMKLACVNYLMDFTHSPDEPVYSFEHDVLRAETGGTFSEVQISSFQFNPFTYVLDRVYRRLNKAFYRRHNVGSYMKVGKKPFVPLPILKRMWIRSLFSIDGTSPWTFLFHLVWSRCPLAVIMGHPKDFNDLVIRNILFLGKRVRLEVFQDLVKES